MLTILHFKTNVESTCNKLHIAQFKKSRKVIGKKRVMKMGAWARP